MEMIVTKRLSAWSSFRILVWRLVAMVVVISACSFIVEFDSTLQPEQVLPQTILRQEGRWENRALSKTPISKKELDHCIDNLELVAVDGHVGEEQFLLFIENFSGRPLYFDEFHELPISLVSIFYTAACTGGRNCSTEKPLISLERIGASTAFLYVFCASVKDVAVVQTILKFQYQVRFDIADHESAADSTLGLGEDLTYLLEQYTQQVLLNEFGCNQEDNYESSRALQVIAPNNERPAKTPLHLLEQWSSSRNKNDIISSMTMRHLSQRGLNLSNEPITCDYSVQARIHHSREMQCLPELENETTEKGGNGNRNGNAKCLLVFSEVRVTAASIFQELSSLEVRSLVSTILQTAIFGKEFDNFLSS